MNINNRNRAIASLLASVFFLGSALPVRAAEATSAGEKVQFETVAPFIDENTYSVAYADISRIDAKVTETWVNDQVVAAHADPDAAKGLAEGMTGARQFVDGWISSFMKAGGRHIYVVASLVDLPNPPIIIVPLAEGADAQAIERLFLPAWPPEHLHSYGVSVGELDGWHAQRFGKVMVFASAAALRRIHEQKPATRPELAAALAEAGDAPIAIAVAPPADTRRVVEETMPLLPPQLGGGPTTVLTRGLLWASLAMRLPPDASIRLTLRARDAGAAKDLSGVINQSLQFLAIGLARDEGIMQRLAQFVKSVSVTLSNDHPDELNLVLDKAAIEHLISLQLPELFAQERGKVQMLRSANNIRQLLLGCIMYANEHNGNWPDDLEKAAKAVSVEGLLNTKPGYVYISPGKAAKIKDGKSLLIIYEAEPRAIRSAGRNVGFADGHVEFMVEEYFQKTLKETKDAAAKREKQN